MLNYLIRKYLYNSERNAMSINMILLLKRFQELKVQGIMTAKVFKGERYE